MATTTAPNPKRVAAGKRNRQKYKGLTPAGRERLRQTALRNQPWRYSTGPCSAQGKARSAANGRVRQKGPISVRQLRAQLAELKGLAQEMRDTRKVAGKARIG